MKKPFNHSSWKKAAFFTLIGSAIAYAAYADTISVPTEYGSVRGQRVSGLITFLGIPFAKPPVGDLRWRAPQSPASWTTIDAMEFKPECSQKKFDQGADTGVYLGSEDCLYLNVWAPSGAQNRPVMVFIHGGGNTQGSTSQVRDGVRMYDGGYLAMHANAVVVTIAYRLGPLGFLVHPGLEAENPNRSSGNYGLLDQIQALRWVQRNIDSFGGDSARVMIFGESAGALDVSILLASPLAAGLFSRALIQSGAAVAGAHAEFEAYGIGFVKDTLNCDGTTNAELIADARSMPPESLFASVKTPVSGGAVSSQWGPVIDGYVLEEAPLTAIEKGRFNNVPVIVGSNADEMSVSAPPVVTPAMVERLIRSSIPSELVDEGLALYPPGATNAEARKSYVGVMTDAQFTVNARRTARAVFAGGGTAYRYFFTHRLSGIQSAFGAFHGIELFYVFRTLPHFSSYADKMTQNDTRVMDALYGFWARFAETGDPNATGETAWAVYDKESDPYLEIEPVPESGSGIRTEKCDFWDIVSKSRTLTVHSPVESHGKGIPAPRAIVLSGNGDRFPAGIASSKYGVNLIDLRGRSVGHFSTANRLQNGTLPSGVYIMKYTGLKGEYR